MPPSNPKGDKWISRGPITASECYSCGNRLDSRVNGETVLILCRDECNYQSVRAK